MHPARLRTATHESPFANLSDPIQVGDLKRVQVAELARVRGLSLTGTDIARLMALVGGHPYLVCAVLDDLCDGHYSLDTLADGGPLGRLARRGQGLRDGYALADVDLRRRRTEHRDGEDPLGRARALREDRRRAARKISRYQKLSEDFIREFKNRVEWGYISEFQKLSENFIREFKDKVDWYNIITNQELSKDFRKEFRHYIRGRR